jgi:D-alanyl-D-alanine endopeptidase (penicillin-binding protein 7)
MNHKNPLATLLSGAFLSLPVFVSADPIAASAPAAVENEMPAVSAADIVRHGKSEKLSLRSRVALVWDDREGVPLYGRLIDQPRSIASLTKLMTALVILEARLPLDELIQITAEDRDTIKRTTSHLPVGAVLTRYDLLHAALASSDNRAAAALGRTWPDGRGAFIQAMNDRAAQLGMHRTRFADPTGLLAGNVSTATDLVKLVAAARSHQLIRMLSTDGEYALLDRAKDRAIPMRNTNPLLRAEESSWDIRLSKTGHTSAAGRCLVLAATVAGRPLTVVLLNSSGRLTRYGDVARIRDWLVRAEQRVPRLTAAIAAGG